MLTQALLLNYNGVNLGFLFSYLIDAFSKTIFAC